MLNQLCLLACMLIDWQQETWFGQLCFILLSQPSIPSFLVSTGLFGSLEGCFPVCDPVNYLFFKIHPILIVKTTVPWWPTSPVTLPPRPLFYLIVASAMVVQAMTITMLPDITIIHRSITTPSTTTWNHSNSLFLLPRISLAPNRTAHIIIQERRRRVDWCKLFLLPTIQQPRDCRPSYHTTGPHYWWCIVHPPPRSGNISQWYNRSSIRLNVSRTTP